MPFPMSFSARLAESSFPPDFLDDSGHDCVRVNGGNVTLTGRQQVLWRRQRLSSGSHFRLSFPLFCREETAGRVLTQMVAPFAPNFVFSFSFLLPSWTPVTTYHNGLALHSLSFSTLHTPHELVTTCHSSCSLRQQTEKKKKKKDERRGKRENCAKRRESASVTTLLPHFWEKEWKDEGEEETE